MQEGGDVTNEPDGTARPQFPGATPDRRAGEVEPQGGAWRSSAEPTVWTARMLATLDRGIAGGRWYSLIKPAKTPPESAENPALLHHHRGHDQSNPRRTGHP